MANIISDALLVQNYVAGNEEALSTLIKKTWIKNLWIYLFKIADRDISNDIFQDTFIKVIKTLKSNSYNEEGKFYRGLCVFLIIWLLIILEKLKNASI
jgi:RNA polymerase sigma-70 factor (ECF subfamily)